MPKQMTKETYNISNWITPDIDNIKKTKRLNLYNESEIWNCKNFLQI